jgi:protein-tyrosine phosphatase
LDDNYWKLVTLRFMTGRIDIHSHLLPGVDDGCESVADSVRCARELVAAGYTHSFCTPHIWPSFPDNNPAEIVRAVERLQQEFDAAGMPLKLMPGGELNMRPEKIPTRLEELVSYGMAGRFVLIDLWADRLPDFFDPSVRALQSLGATVILAHPERMRAVQEEPELADHFAELGMLLQGNLQCFGDPPHAATRQTAERFLEEGRYFAVGSDLHNPQTLGVRLAGLRRVRQAIGEEGLELLTRINPGKLIR